MTFLIYRTSDKAERPHVSAVCVQEWTETQEAVWTIDIADRLAALLDFARQLERDDPGIRGVLIHPNAATAWIGDPDPLPESVRGKLAGAIEIYDNYRE